MGPAGPLVALIGRTNVGKSRLFNRLIKSRTAARALVDPQEAVTRDRREAPAALADLRFVAVDTAGLDAGDTHGSTLLARAAQQTRTALRGADLALFLWDVRAGVTPLDEDLARWIRSDLRGAAPPIISVANKSETLAIADENLDQGHALGFGDTIALSAESGFGMTALYDALRPHVDGWWDAHAARQQAADALHDPAEPAPETDAEAMRTRRGPLRIAVIGRPNSGKSTLVNKLLREDRVLTGATPGVTRDAVHIPFRLGGRDVVLVDTAGIRRRARDADRLEEASVASSYHAIKYAHAVILVMDAVDEPLCNQDLALAGHVLDQGRALVIAANKIDCIPDKQLPEFKKFVAERLGRSLSQARGIAAVPISAETGAHLPNLITALFRTSDRWDTRVSTGPLNRWLGKVTAFTRPPRGYGLPRFITQVRRRPPSFVISHSGSKSPSDAYIRYLTNSLRDNFDLQGVPIRVMVNKTERKWKRK